MASIPALNSLPLEIVASIANLVDTVDRRSLRLVAHRLAHQLYPEMPMAKTLNAASESDLQMLIAMTEVGQPGCSLECLTLVEKLGEHDVAIRTARGLEEEAFRKAREQWDTDSEPGNGSPSEMNIRHPEIEHPLYVPTAGYMGRIEEPGSSLDVQASTDLLAQAFKNFSNHSASKALFKLALRTVNCRRQFQNSFRWEHKPLHTTRTTGDLQKRVFSALHASRLPVTALYIEGLNQGNDMTAVEENRFVFGCDGLAAILGTVNLEPSFHSLKDFSIEFSPSSHDIEYPEPELDSEGKKCEPGPRTRKDYKPLMSICDFLKFCPNLERLRLKGYDAFGAGEVSLLRQIVDSCALPSLKTCTLDGFGTRNGELLSFLRHFSRLESFSMIALYETNEQYVEIFNHIASKMPQLKHFHLDNMWERTLHTDGEDEEWVADKRHIVGLCWFKPGGPGGVQHYSHKIMSGANQITREGEAIHSVIEKKEFRGGRALGSVGFYRWQPQWAANYGPYPSWS